MKIVYIFILIIIFLFLPIPLKIYIAFENNELIIKLYNKKIYPLPSNAKKKPLVQSKKKRNRIIKFYKNKKLSPKKFLREMKNSRFKPSINFEGSLSFGLEDAALCAILYGIFCNIPYILKIILSKFLNLKLFNISIEPKFNTKTLFFNIRSIFYLSLANIIYILFLMLKSFEIIEGTLKKEEKIHG
ncbi:DUF2953 domain-containing protein [Caproiciproducens sp. MSJ-32]|uniref:DUF2953 domain-containing protein n=1 Tax=Caproiciproducens sp. MSJ-32 TaxID=2841527 RepID=UPI001C1109E1|nr:DUF2953 domain-containing protein [Caproiciproducens sp. MSJ-32]MBU5454556.1 DUF2953 domain-containing protein [Caproiciproducens sp. MSJ-32]